MNRKALIIGLAITLPIIVLLAVSFGRDPHKVNSPLVGKPAPDFTLPAVGGQGPISLSSLRGKPVVVNFWATWCVPCFSEHPVLQNSAASMRDVQFLGVIYDDTEPNIQKFLAQNGSSYPSLMDQGGRIAIAYGVYGVPETFFIDPSGMIVAKHEGPLDYGQIQDYIQRMSQKKVASREGTP
jgi:cytochrome c biogenesis protein CcmG/thiol:disulfide interchange protein DsbE